MQPSSTRKALSRNGVAAGSVWEARMKLDEVTGGIKVFNAAASDSCDDEEGVRVHEKLRRNRSGGGIEKRKRKSWKQPEPPLSPIQLRKAKPTEIGCKSGVEEKGVLHVCDEKGAVGEMEDEDNGKEIEKQKSFDDKEMDLPAEKEMMVEDLPGEKEKMVEELKEIEEQEDMAVVEKMTSYVEELKVKDQDPSPQNHEDEGEEILFDTISESSNSMQHIVDLIMWRDIAKTSFAFGFGTFLLLSSSYAKDLNFSLISTISYLGLLYLAIIFLLRSILRRGKEPELRVGDEGYLVREEEAVWVLRRILPYFNELLLRTRALFSGDPAITMKMAVILFVMARCGGAITFWTLAKLVFYGVFTVPKVLSSYSVQLSRHGQFWLARFQDGWESCTHKKAIAAAFFILFWNLSSTIARIWALFMLVISIRLYQQYTITTWYEDEDVTVQNQHQSHPQQRQQHQQQQQLQKRQGFANRSGMATALPRRQGLAGVGRNANTKKVK